MSVRSQAIAQHDASIDESQQRAIVARQEQSRPRSALEAMAQRLQVSPKSLQNTLVNTAFKGCSEAEFVALVIVANTYELNPLLREIYAFPKKGGGIQAIVGYDGWIKISNSHPQYDCFEADHIEDEKGDLKAIEGICHRKDRRHPTKKMVYLKEFKRNTEPWNNSPRHMLDVRCFCQTIRIGLGVSGLGVEGIDDVEGVVIEAKPARLPSSQSLAEELDDEIPDFDKETGEVGEANLRRDAATGMTEVDEETARQLDAKDAGQGDGTADDDGQEDAEEEDESARRLRSFREDIALVKNAKQLKAVDDRWVNARAAYDDAAVLSEIDGLINARRKALAGEG